MFVELMSKYKTDHKRKKESEEGVCGFTIFFNFQCAQCYGEEYTGGLNTDHFDSHVIFSHIAKLFCTRWLPVL